MVGFIGLGIMGKPIVKNLLKAGIAVRVNDLVKSSVDEVALLGAIPSSQAEIGGSCDVIFTILPNGEIVQSVLFGKNGAAPAIKPGTLVVDMSSVTPAESRLCAGKLAGFGAAFLDAPVSGGEPGAIAGTLSFMVGGSEEAFRRALPYFNIMGTSATLVGPVGSGSIAKLANQIIVNLGIAAVSEALVLAAKAGADPERVFQAIRGGLAGSAVLEAKAPMMYSRDFKPGGKISINHKDIKNVMAAAHALDVPLPLSAQLYEILQSLMIHGCADMDHSAIVRYFEELAMTVVQKKSEED